MMDEKLKKVLKTSKQGIWLVLILAIVMNVIGAIGSKSILAYVENNWVSLIYMGSLIAGLVLYKKEKYCQGAEIVQWAALGNIILQFAQIITIYVITKAWAINIVSFLIGAIVPIILIVESLKVIRLTEEGNRSNIITIIAIVIIATITISQIIVIYNANKILDDMKDDIQSGEVNKEEDKATVDGTEQEGNEDKESESTIDPYANYKDIKWSETSASNASILASIKIQNKKVYITEDLEFNGNNKTTKIKGISGTPIKVTLRDIGGMFDYVILTKEGKIYSIMYGNTNIAPRLTDLSKHNIIDMTSGIDGDVVGEIYFLTSEGKLINFEGKESNYKFIVEGPRG